MKWITKVHNNLAESGSTVIPLQLYFTNPDVQSPQGIKSIDWALLGP